jgi:hypothetical protein
LLNRRCSPSFDPSSAKDTQAKGEAVISYAKEVKDWPTLIAAIDQLVGHQREIVNWWRENVRGRGKKANVSDRKHFVEDAEKIIKFTKLHISRWGQALEDEQAYKTRLFGDCYDAAMGQKGAPVRGTAGTGDNEWYTPASYVQHGDWLPMIEGELPFGRTTAFMLMKIAEDLRLSNVDHGKHLPPSWRTLYELTKLSDSDFETGIRDGTINPEMERSASVTNITRPPNIFEAATSRLKIASCRLCSPASRPASPNSQSRRSRRVGCAQLGVSFVAHARGPGWKIIEQVRPASQSRPYPPRLQQAPEARSFPLRRVAQAKTCPAGKQGLGCDVEHRAPRPAAADEPGPLAPHAAGRPR